ncbi:MAG: response regulator [Lachnospiraceae bacterium]|nr:response regulator [Lachnospiraceae bacterium]
MIGERFSVSRVYVFENSEDNLYAYNTFEWCAEGIEPQKDYLQHMSYEEYGYNELFNDEGLFFAADVSMLEPLQRELFEMQGIKATMQYAMYEKGVFRGFIGLDDCNLPHPDWDKDKEIVETLVLLAQILTMYLLKERNLQNAKAYHSQLTQALESANAAKQESEHQLNSALQGMNGGVALYRSTMEGRLDILSFTDGIAQMHGCTRQEYVELTKQDPLHTMLLEDRGYMAAEIQQLLKSRGTLSMTYRGYHKEKDYVWINLSAFPMGIDEDGCLRYTAVFTTASREFELYQDLLDNSENGVIVSDRKSNEVYISNRAAKFLMREWELEPFTGSFEPKKITLHNGKVYQVFTHEIDWLGRSAIARYFLDLTEEATLQKELSNEEERYRMVVEKSHIAFMDQDLLHSTMYCNDLYKQYRVSTEDALGTFDYYKRVSTVHPEDKEMLYNLYQDIKKEKMGVAYPIRLLMQDGSYRWSELHGIEIDDAAGNPIRKIGFIRDIDEEIGRYRDLKARYDFEVEKQNENDEDIIERILIDLTDNQVLQAADASGMQIKKMQGLTVEELLKLRLTHSRDAKERQELSNLMNRKSLLEAYAQLKTPEAEIKAHFPGLEGKQHFRSTVRLVKNPENEHIFAFFVTRNVDRQKAEAILMRRLLETNYSSVAVVYTKSGKLKLGYAKGDKGFAYNIDLSYDEMMQAVVAQYVIPDEWKQVWKEMNLEKIKQELEHTNQASGRALILRDGKRVFKTWTAAYFDEEKELILITTADATETYQRDLENSIKLAEALERAEKASRAKNDFLSRMSHDMRTPMNAILGMTHLAAECVEKGSKVAEYLSQIDQSSQYLLGIINDILEMGRIESGKVILNPSWYNMQDLFGTIIRMIEPLMEKKKIHFDFDRRILNKSNIEIYEDIQKSQQMIMNLLNNACKFTPEGGTVRLTFENVSLDKDALSGVDKIVIQDTGCGMSKEFLEHIFTPFEQERLPGAENIPGTGLGLSIAYSIAKAMGGNITVESEVGTGSTFTLFHPFQYRMLEKKEAEKAVLQKSFDSLEGSTVLLAEDNEINAMIATKLLENRGIEVQLAVNGQEAVDLFAKAPEKTFDLILMDIRMPIMDGLEATKCIRKLNRPDAKTIPIIAMSANAFEEDKRTSIRAGMTNHLAKPVEPEVLYQELLKWIKHL